MAELTAVMTVAMGCPGLEGDGKNTKMVLESGQLALLADPPSWGCVRLGEGKVLENGRKSRNP